MKKLVPSFIVTIAAFSMAIVSAACSDDSSTNAGGTIEDTNSVADKIAKSSSSVALSSSSEEPSQPAENDFTEAEIAIVDSIIAANMVSPNSSNSARTDDADLDSVEVTPSPATSSSRSKIDDAYRWEDRENVYTFHNNGNVNYCAVFASEINQGLFQTQSEKGGSGYVIFEMVETEFGVLAMEYMHYSHWDMDCTVESDAFAKECEGLGGYYKLEEKSCQKGYVEAACSYKVTDKDEAQKNFEEKAIANCKDFESTHPDEVIPSVYCEGSSEGGMKCDTTYSDTTKQKEIPATVGRYISDGLSCVVNKSPSGIGYNFKGVEKEGDFGGYSIRFADSGETVSAHEHLEHYYASAADNSGCLADSAAFSAECERNQGTLKLESLHSCANNHVELSCDYEIVDENFKLDNRLVELETEFRGVCLGEK